MKIDARTLSRIVVAAALSAMGAWAWSQQTPPGELLPKCVVKETMFDAGTIVKGDPIKHDFILENQGKAVLEITAVKPGCGCTVTQYDPKIEPGKTGKISATVSTANFSGPTQKGITVTTNDVQMATFQLSLKADVHGILNVGPSESQQFGLVFRGQSLQRDFTITAEDGAPFQINSVQAEDPSLKFDVTPARDHKSVLFKVTLPADHPVGPVTGRFTLATTHPKVPSLVVSVFGTVRDTFTLAPAEVHFAAVSKSWADEHPEDASLRKSIALSDEQGPELEVKSARSTLPILEVEVKELEPKKRYSVELRIKPPVKAGDFSGEVAIRTNLKTFTVPVTGRIF